MGCSVLRTKLHNHPVPQDMVLTAMHETGSMPLSTGLIREDIHDPECELWKIPLPRTPLNKGGLYSRLSRGNCDYRMNPLITAAVSSGTSTVGNWLTPSKR
jgi:hypothetical protein